MNHQPWKRTLCCLMTAVLLLGNIPVFSFAEESEGLCPHHTTHTDQCGYAPASPGSPCTHEHTEDCYQTVTNCVHAHDGTCGYVEAVEGHGCDCVPDAAGVLTHAEGCGYVEAVEGVPCGHVCSVESKCVTRELVCPHAHDGSCGYTAPTPEQPCTYVCQTCADSKAAEGVQALMDALPTPEEVKAMSMEDQAKVYNQVQSAYDAYEALTESQKALIVSAESTFAPLFDYFNSLTAPAATHSHAVCGESSCSHNHSSQTWKAWDGKSNISNSYYYLTQDVVRTTYYNINGDVGICLNGHTLSTEGNCPVFVVNKGAHLYICDCVGGGKLISDDGDTSGATSSEVGIENHGGVVLWGGCISGKWTGVECTDGTIGVYGGTIESRVFEGITLSGTSTLKMTGGVVSGTPAISGKDSTSQITISGGRTDSAGNVSIATDGSIVISGGTVGNGVSGHQVSLSGSPSVPYIASNSAVVLRDDNGNSYTGSGFTLKSGVSSGSIAVTQLPDQKYANQITVTDGTNTGLMAGRLTLSGTDALTIDRPIASGSAGTGSSVQWALYDNGDFYLLGSGAVPDYSSASYAPWYSYRSRITSLVVSDGITGIGSNAFRDSGLESVSFGKASLSLGNYSFANCAFLKTIDFGSGTITPGKCVFEYCTALTTVSVPANVTMVGSYSGIGSGYRMFGGCTGLQTATVDCAYVGPFFFESCTSMTQATFTNASVQFYFLEENSGHPFHANSQAMNVTVVGYLCSRANVLVQRSQGRYNLTLTFSQIAGDTTQHTEQVLAGTATCTAAGLSKGKVCSVCGYVIEKQTNVGALGHDIQKHKGQPATCTEKGWEAYDTCSRCDYTTYKELPATGHTLSHVDGKDATCTEAGVKEHYHCSVCDKNFADKDGNTELTDTSIPTKAHTLTKVDGSEPTCTDKGVKEHYHCSACDKNFEDANGTTEMTDIFIPTVEHEWGEWAVTTPATPEADGVETRKCTVCQQEETRPLTYTGNRLVLTGTELENQSTVWIDGVPVSIEKDDVGNSYVTLPENSSSILVTYSYNTGSGDRHTQYPTGMQVYRISEAGSRYTVERIQELDNLLQYSGSSIRITGNKGIRMITSVNQDTRNKLTGNGLAGFKLLEYGTLLAQTSKLGNNPLVLGGANVKSNYAYKKGVADPVFKYANGLIQYTNVLVGFADEQCKEDIAMRPYMKLEDENGEEFVIYGGIVYRSIGYIAWQNKDVFSPGTAAYNYVWDIIHAVYGDDYNG